MKTLCISHRKDVDGLASAALVRWALGAEVKLASYGDLIEVLKGIDGTELGELYICDLGMNERLLGPFLEQLKRIGGGKVVYTDHHPLSKEAREALEGLGVRLNHSQEECAGVLTYLLLRDRLPKEASLLACYAAITDYLDDAPQARALMAGQDRQFLLLEATLLSYALARKGREEGFPEALVEALSRGEPPHRIDGVVEAAVEQLDRVVELLKGLRERGKLRRGFAYIDAGEDPTGLLASLLLGAFGVRVGVAYRLQGDGYYEISLRGSPDLEIPLGRVAQEASKEVGGAGGGHAKASGARIPAQGLEGFLRRVEELLD